MEDTVKVNSAQEFFDIMDGVAAKRKLYPEVIKEYLKTKDIKPFYMVEYDDPMYDEPVKILRRLTDENIADIESLVDAYIEKSYPEEIASGGKDDKTWRKDIMPEVAESNDYFVDKEYLHSENLMFNQMNVTNIDIYEKYYCYRIKVAAFLEGMEKNPEYIGINIHLSDEEYMYLTTEFMIDTKLSFNQLRNKNNDLYIKICNIVDRHFYHSDMTRVIPTYAVELTEIMEDAKACLEILEHKK